MAPLLSRSTRGRLSVVLAVVSVVSVVVAEVPLARATAAAAQITPTLTITASTTTTVGLQIFANSNLLYASSPTGSITFELFGPGDTSCSTEIFTSTVAVTGQSSDSARFTTVQAGTYRWVSSYSGDANHAAVGPTSCSDPSAEVIVGKARAAIVIAAPAPVGGTIRGEATLISTRADTGTITFLLTPPGDTFCSATPVFTSTAPVRGGGVYASTAYTPTVTGTYTWRARYGGDANTLGAGYTGCFDDNASVTVTSLTLPPTTTTTTRPTTTTLPPTTTTTTTLPPTTTTRPTTTTTRPTTTTTTRPTTTTLPPTTTTTLPPTTTTLPPTTTTTLPPTTTTTTTLPPTTTTRPTTTTSRPTTTTTTPTTTTTTPPPAADPHWGPYRWGSVSSPVRALRLYDRTGDPAMHTMIANWAAWWNQGRAQFDTNLPLVVVIVEDDHVGQCVNTDDPAYSFALVCAGGPATPLLGKVSMRYDASSHIVSPFATLRRNLDTNSLATSVCRQMGVLMGLEVKPASGSCLSASVPPATFLWYDAADWSAARTLYDGHAA